MIPADGNLAKIKRGSISSKYDLIVCDFMSMCYKYFYGLKNLHNSLGEKTGLFHGFLYCILSKAIESPKSKIIVAHEGGGLVRKQISELYKSQRKKKPDELLVARDRLTDILAMMGMDQRFLPGYEADDVAGSVVKGYRKVLLISGDMDWFQILRKNFKILQNGKEIGYEKATKQLGYPPERIIIYKMLKGDPSDNIKGIMGFPNELALEICNNCKNIQEVYKYKPRKESDVVWMESILRFKEQTAERYNLLRIKCDGITEEVACLERKNLVKLKKILLELELFKVLNLLRKIENSGHII